MATPSISGTLCDCTRQTAEVQGIPFENIQLFCIFLEKHGLQVGGTGPRVRPVVSCKGTTCVFGLIDTYSLSQKIHELYYVGYHAVKLPHKFKIAVGGCPNNCVKPDLNDVGVVGAWKPLLNAELCAGCGACVTACPLHVATLKDGQFANTKDCNKCGRCVRACKLGGLEYQPGYRLSLGGRWGKLAARGQFLQHLFESEEEVLAAVEKAILLFRDKGLAGERFADTVGRLGMEEVERLILSNELLERKAEILEKTL